MPTPDSPLKLPATTIRSFEAAQQNFQAIERAFPLASTMLGGTTYGRGFLPLADAAAGLAYLGALSAALAASTYQPLDSDLTDIAALTTTAFGRSLLTQADAPAARTTLGVASAKFFPSGAGVVNGNTISGGTGAWGGAGAYSPFGFYNGCHVAFYAGQNTHSFMVSLNTDPSASSSYGDLDYAWHITNDGQCQIYESGVWIAGPWAYTTNDLFEIRYDGMNVRYYQNGVLRWTVARAMTGAPFYMDAALQDVSTVVTNVVFNSNDFAVEKTNYVQNVKDGMTGGGVLTYTAAGGISWSARWITLGLGKGTSTATEGYFNIEMPPNGTVITGYGGAANQTVAGGLIPMAGWTNLWYELPLGSDPTSLPWNFKLTSYTDTHTVPDNWVLIAALNSDSPNAIQWANGSRQGLGTTIRPDRVESVSAYSYSHGPSQNMTGTATLLAGLASATMVSGGVYLVIADVIVYYAGACSITLSLTYGMGTLATKVTSCDAGINARTESITEIYTAPGASIFQVFGHQSAGAGLPITIDTSRLRIVRIG